MLSIYASLSLSDTRPKVKKYLCHKQNFPLGLGIEVREFPVYKIHNLILLLDNKKYNEKSSM